MHVTLKMKLSCFVFATDSLACVSDSNYATHSWAPAPSEELERFYRGQMALSFFGMACLLLAATASFVEEGLQCTNPHARLTWKLQLSWPNTPNSGALHIQGSGTERGHSIRPCTSTCQLVSSCPSKEGQSARGARSSSRLLETAKLATKKAVKLCKFSSSPGDPG